MTDAIAVAGLRKSYGKTVALDGLDLGVAEGEVHGFLGPNGAGKTTTLMMLLGVITPDAGTIELVGRPLPAQRSEAMESVGFAAGYLPLPERLRVHEFLRLFADLYGITDGREAVARGLARFRIECGNATRRKIDHAGFGQLVAIEGCFVFEFAPLR